MKVMKNWSFEVEDGEKGPSAVKFEKNSISFKY